MDKFDMIRRIRLEFTGVKKTKMEEGEMENPCQDGYIAYGTKEKDTARIYVFQSRTRRSS